MSTLTRAEAHALVDAAYLGEDDVTLSELAEAWAVAGHWNETVPADHWYSVLHEFVDQQACDDETRANGPRDNDETGLAVPCGS